MKKKFQFLLLSIVLVFFGINGFGQSTNLPTLPSKSIQAWIYPGNPACNSSNEFKDGRIIDVLRSEYLTLTINGSVVQKTVADYGCNAYSTDTAADVKNHSSYQFITVSGAGSSLDSLLNHVSDNNWIITNFINPIKNLVDTTINTTTGFTGIDLDLENPGGWNAHNYWTHYKSLITTLGDTLHNYNKLLNITLPSGLNNDLSFFNNNASVDYVTIMCYDYMLDTTIDGTNWGLAGLPIAPTNWVEQEINNTISKMPNSINKIIIGMPSYGYHGTTGTYNITGNESKDIISNYQGYNTANRDTSSYEMTWQNNNTSYFYQDAIGMSEKVEFIRYKGIKHVSVWSLGGNDWFNKFQDTSYRQVRSVLDSTLWKNALKALSYSTTHDTTCAYPSSTNAGNQIIFADTINYTNALFKGMEVAIIGHAENDTNQCSTISVDYSNDGINWYSPESATDTVKIYSNHDVIKIIGSETDNWGFTSAPFVAYQIRIKYLSGAVPHINGVFVKMYFGNPGQQGSITDTFQVKASPDDARCKNTNGSLPNYTVTSQYLGTYSSNDANNLGMLNGLRFKNITISQGATIDYATFELFYAFDSIYNNITYNRVLPDIVNTTIFCEDTSNSQAFNLQPLFNRKKTTDSVNYTYQILSPTNNTGFGVLGKPDISNIIQDIINRADWNQGDSLSLLIEPNNVPNGSYIGFSTYDRDTTRGAKLIIKYHYPVNLYCEYYNTPQHITSDTIWNDDPSNPKIVLNDVIVNPGVTLTITGTVEFTQQAKLIVQQGGVLIIDGGTLTNLCDNKTWRGIEVWGTKGKGQNSILNSPYQGMVQLINGAEIDNAEDAIRLWQPNYSTTTGGFVIANNATFYNNRRSIDFEPYQNKIISPSNDTTNIGNFSQFVNCTFDVDDDYLSDNDFYCHAYLWNVNGIFFQGCTFMNEQSNRQYDLTNNKGIYSMDAGFTVNGYCSDNVLYGQSCPYESLSQCYFSGFNYAVHALNSATSNVAIVDESVFEHNVIGVQYQVLNNSWVNRSKFSIGDSTITNTPTYHEGIVTIGSTGYRIEEDTLQLSSYPASNNNGIRINNSLTANNQVYKNTTIGLTRGEQAEGVNKNSTYNFKGLQLLCNTHIQNTKAINIASLTGTPGVQGIRYYQGDSITLASAGNIFSQNDSDIVNGTHSPIMYYCTNGLTQPLRFTPILVDTIHVNNENKCLSNFNNGYSFPLSIESVQTFATHYGLLESTYLNLLYNYNSMIDGGDENLLLDKIESTWSGDAWKMRADLLAQSPYLSEDALKQVALSGILPQAMLLEVCLANPEATRDENFIYLLGNLIPNPLPQYMLDLIVENWYVKTARTLLEANLADVSSQMYVITNLLVSNYMLDSVQRKDIALNWLLRRGDVSDYYSAAEYYIENSDYETGYHYLEQIPELFKLTDDEQAEYLNFKDYFEFRNSIASNNRNIMQLTDDEINTLKQIADNNTGRSSILSQNILCFFYQMCVDYLTDENEGKHLSFSKPKIPASQIIQSAYNKITASPNPASVYVAFSWTLPLLKGNAELLITDVNGKTIAQQTITAKRGQWIWDTRAIKNSIYLYEVRSDNQRLGNGKIVINN